MKFTDYIYSRDKKNEVYKHVMDYMNVIDKYGNKIWTILSDKDDADLVCFIFPHMADHFTFVCDISFDWYHMCIECYWRVSNGNGFVSRVYMNGLTSEMFTKWFIDSTELFIKLSNIMESDILIIER